MVYRKRTYIAGDWTGDQDAVEQLYKWKDGRKWSLDFPDAHEVTQARDNSLNCSIKKSLKTRLDASKIFVLIVGEKTNTVTSGSCQHCSSKISNIDVCAKRYSVDKRSYIKYECDKAVEAYNAGKMQIVVLYNAARVMKSKCPDAVRDIGTHEKMRYIFETNGKRYWAWDYQAVKTALGQ